jgi:hypothetical protein
VEERKRRIDEREKGEKSEKNQKSGETDDFFAPWDMFRFL